MGKLQKRKNIIYLKKRCIKRKFTEIHDRFLRDPDFRKSMLEHDRDEDVCLKWDDLAEQDFNYRMSEPEYCHYRQNGWISLKKSGDTGGPLRNRSDFNQAFSTLNRLHRESGGQQLRAMPYWKYQQWQPSSSSSSTWWQVNPGGLPKNSKKVNERGCMQRLTIERCNPLSTDLGVKPQTKGFHEFILFCCR